jgi:diaminopimelate epimerase
MHGLGNDFIIPGNFDLDNYDLSKLASELCDRRLGIGADGIILVLPSDKADVRMRIINSDGSEPDMCGNGIRCFARFVYENGIVDKTEFSVETFAGIMVPGLNIEDGKVVSVQVNMGKPTFNRIDIPMLGNSVDAIAQPLSINGSDYSITSMLMGVPHTMVYADIVANVNVEKDGSLIEKNELFPEGTNVNFVEVINMNEIIVRTWERGAGATMACGTGCCASVVSSVLNKKTGNKVIVHLPVGDMVIEWNKGEDVFMTGPAELVFEGVIEI